MIIQRCPRCGSSRIRRGYRPTPWWQAIFGRYNLLCNSCNWEFAGLAIPGTVAEQQHSRKRKKNDHEKARIQPQVTDKEVNSFAETQELSETISLNDSNVQNSVESVDNLQARPEHNLPPEESQSNISDKASNLFPIIEATDEISLNFNKTLELLKGDENFNNVSDESNAEITINDKAKKQPAKSKKRANVKKKK